MVKIIIFFFSFLLFFHKKIKLKMIFSLLFLLFCLFSSPSLGLSGQEIVHLIGGGIFERFDLPCVHNRPKALYDKLVREMMEEQSYCLVRYYYRPEYYQDMLKVIEMFKSLSYPDVTFQGSYPGNHVTLWINGTGIPTTKCPEHFRFIFS